MLIAWERGKSRPAEQRTAEALGAASCFVDISWPYTDGVSLTKIEGYVYRLMPEEISDGLWLVGVFERWGSMTLKEADEWRRRILARRRYPQLNAEDPNADCPKPSPSITTILMEAPSYCERGGL